MGLFGLRGLWVGIQYSGAGILICGFGGALGWFVYLIARLWVGGIVAAFLAAVAITIFSEWMAGAALSRDGLSSGGVAPPGARLRNLLLHAVLCGGRYPTVSVHLLNTLAWRHPWPSGRCSPPPCCACCSLFSWEPEKQRMIGGAVGDNYKSCIRHFDLFFGGTFHVFLNISTGCWPVFLLSAALLSGCIQAALFSGERQRWGGCLHRSRRKRLHCGREQFHA